MQKSKQEITKLSQLSKLSQLLLSVSSIINGNKYRFITENKAKLKSELSSVYLKSVGDKASVINVMSSLVM